MAIEDSFQPIRLQYLDTIVRRKVAWTSLRHKSQKRTVLAKHSVTVIHVKDSELEEVVCWSQTRCVENGARVTPLLPDIHIPMGEGSKSNGS